MSELTKKWSDIGFLHNIEGQEDRNNLAIKFEELSMILKETSDYNRESDWFKTVVFPILYRVFKGCQNVNVQHLYIHTKNWASNNYDRILIDKGKSMLNGIDTEVEEVASYSNLYINRCNKNITPINFLRKFKF